MTMRICRNGILIKKKDVICIYGNVYFEQVQICVFSYVGYGL